MKKREIHPKNILFDCFEDVVGLVNICLNGSKSKLKFYSTPFCPNTFFCEDVLSHLKTLIDYLF